MEVGGKHRILWFAYHSPEASRFWQLPWTTSLRFRLRKPFAFSTRMAISILIPAMWATSSASWAVRPLRKRLTRSSKPQTQWNTRERPTWPSLWLTFPSCSWITSKIISGKCIMCLGFRVSYRMKPASAEKILAAFEVLDPENKKYLTKQYFGKLMAEEGEPFARDELEAMWPVAIDPITGNIPFTFYINQLKARHKFDCNMFPAKIFCPKSFSTRPRSTKSLMRWRRNWPRPKRIRVKSHHQQ